MMITKKLIKNIYDGLNDCLISDGKWTICNQNHLDKDKDIYGMFF